jgi:hypothetical protein
MPIDRPDVRDYHGVLPHRGVRRTGRGGRVQADSLVTHMSLDLRVLGAG